MKSEGSIFEYVPLSECRDFYRLGMVLKDGKQRIRTTIRALWLRRALRDLCEKYDDLKQDYDMVLAERDAMQFAATQAIRESEVLRKKLDDMIGEL